MNAQFGAGKIFVRPYTGAGVPGSPIELAILQEASVEFKVNTKKLWGAKRFPVTIADGEGEIPISCKAAAFYGNAFNLVLNGISSSGGRSNVLDEVGLVATGAYDVGIGSYIAGTTVVWLTPAGGGVARQLALVGSSPVAGVSYTESTPGSGELSFATGDNGATVRVSYAFALTSGGQQIAIPNALMNSSLGAKVSLYNQSLNRANNRPSTMILDLNQVILPGLKLDFKLGDFTIPDFNLEASADQNDQVGMLYLYNYDV